MFKNLRLRNKILLGYVPPIVLLIVSALLVFNSVRTAASHSDRVSTAYRIMYELRGLELSGSIIQRGARGYYLTKDENFLKTVEEGESDLKISTSTLKGLIGTIEKDPVNNELFEKIVKSGNDLIAGVTYRISLAKEENLTQVIKEIQEKGVNQYEEFNKFTNQLQEREERVLAGSLKSEEEALRFLILTIFAGTIVSSLLAILIGFGLATNISSTINETTTSLSSTSSEIASTVEQHERTATEQAASVSETTATIDEISVSSRQSIEQADAVAVMAKQAQTITGEGAGMAEQASDGMLKMKEKVEGIGGQILHLSDQTGQIGKIANMVTDIAGQINMLALNAAVEAVRAGEQGKGFAVIAQEVRKLADQAKKSAEQANTIVTEIQKATNSAVMVTEEGTKTVSEVEEIARKAGEAFISLSSVATNVYENAQQVLLNSRQQSAAIKQVTDAMNNISAGARETAAGISQTKIGIQRLNEAAQGLKKMV